MKLDLKNISSFLVRMRCFLPFLVVCYVSYSIYNKQIDDGNFIYGNFRPYIFVMNI